MLAQLGRPRAADGEPRRHYPAPLRPHQGDDFGSRWTWINRPLGIRQIFIFGSPDTLPCEALRYITRQAQGDFAICDQRDNNPSSWTPGWSRQADWSLEFDVGMSFMEWHGPGAPGPPGRRLRAGAQIPADAAWGQPMRPPQLDDDHPAASTPRQGYPGGAPDRANLTRTTSAAKLHLRVRLQTLWRLPAATRSCSRSAATPSLLDGWPAC